MAFPLLIRDITIPGVRSDGYRDAACVPGLTGPVVSQGEFPEDVRHGLMHQFQDFLEENRIVSVYSRLHFLMGQEDLLSGYGELREEGMEVTVDLTVPPEEHLARYRRGHRSDLKSLWNMELTFEEVGPEYLDEFVRLYYPTMNRVGASERYYVEKSYFEYLLTEMRDFTRLFVAKHNDTVVAAELDQVCNGHIRGYLYGDMEEYRRLGVSKLMYHSVIVWGHSTGFRVFHLGGGSPSLCNCKMGFNGRKHVYSTWRHIADSAVYEDLCRQVYVLSGRKPNDAYFPEYRSPSLGLG